MQRLFLLLVLAFVPLCSHALIQPQSQWALQWNWENVTQRHYGASASDACAQATAAGNARIVAQGFQLGGVTFSAPKNCKAMSSTGIIVGSSDAQDLGGATCPANSTAVTGGCQCNTNFDESGGQCVPHVNQCTSKTGQVGLLNWTEGYTRTPDEGDRQAVGGPVISPPSSGQVCDGGCNVSLQVSGPGVQAYVSQAPTANGLYRRSVDYPSLNLGTECTMGAADAGAKKDLPPPDCPGSVGEVAGKTVCVGTAAKPVSTSPIGQPPATPIAGNPAAGPKPVSGDGSGSGSTGRTPTSGTGTATGGPAGAGVGGKGGGAGGTAASGAGGMGTDEKPTPCGSPGQPVCAVKVDEKGTPEGAGTTYDVAKAKMDETKGKNDEQLAKAAGQGDKGFLEPVRSLFWSPPIAACEPVALPSSFQGLSLDPCGVVDGARGLMGFLWAAGGLFVCLGMVKKVI